MLVRTSAVAVGFSFLNHMRST